MKIGLFSGSFDPVHTGHAMMANYASQCAGVDEVWMMPSRLNPFKAGSTPAPDGDRLEMCRLAAAPCPRVRVSDFELSLPSPSYTYRTLCELRKHYPRHQFVLIIGSDNWPSFGKWKNPQQIIDEFGLIIYPRPGFDIDKETLPENVTLLDQAPMVLMSSTFVRQSLREGMDMHYFLPTDVLRYIKERELYG